MEDQDQITTATEESKEWFEWCKLKLKSLPTKLENRQRHYAQLKKIKELLKVEKELISSLKRHIKKGRINLKLTNQK